MRGRRPDSSEHAFINTLREVLGLRPIPGHGDGEYETEADRFCARIYRERPMDVATPRRGSGC